VFFTDTQNAFEIETQFCFCFLSFFWKSHKQGNRKRLFISYAYSKTTFIKCEQIALKREEHANTRHRGMWLYRK
jgi:hypothetical protein